MSTPSCQPSSPLSVVLLGSGGVATSIAHAVVASPLLQLTAVYSKTLAHAQKLATQLTAPQPQATDQISALPSDAHLYIIAVKDQYIASVAGALTTDGSGIVLHTSAATPIEHLAPHLHRGILYPPNTFSVERVVSFQELCFLTEYNTPEAQEVTARFISAIGALQQPSTLQTRRCFHVAAVFACNFVNHLYAMSAQLLHQSALPWSILAPLISETTQKALLLGPQNTQTGPAVRHDHGTIATHLAMLKEQEPLFVELYEKFTKDIMKKHPLL